MTPSEAAEGRRLLESAERNADVDDVVRLSRWLWANREELVRCAEERAATDQFAPTETACTCMWPAGPPSQNHAPGCPSHRAPDPRLAHALANPPGPRGAVVREALASTRLDTETHCVDEPQGAPCCHHPLTEHDAHGFCSKCECGGYLDPGAPHGPGCKCRVCVTCDWSAEQAQGAPQKPEGET